MLCQSLKGKREFTDVNLQKHWFSFIHFSKKAKRSNLPLISFRGTVAFTSLLFFLIWRRRSPQKTVGLVGKTKTRNILAEVSGRQRRTAR